MDPAKGIHLPAGQLRLSGLFVQLSQQVVTVGKVRIQLKSPAGGSQRLLESAQVPVGLGERMIQGHAVSRRHILLLELQQMLDRLGRVAGLEQCLSQLKPCRIVIGIIPEFRLQRLHGRIDGAGVHVNHRQGGVDPRIAGILASDGLELLQGQVVPVEVIVASAQPQAGLQQVGIQCNRALQGLEPLGIHIPHPRLAHAGAGLLEYGRLHGPGQQEFAQGQLKLGPIGLGSHGFPQMLFSFRVLLQFQQDGAVQVEMLRFVAVLLHGLLSRQHGQQELSLVEPLPGFPVVGRLGPARRHQAQEPGKSPKKNTRSPRIHPTPIGGRIATGIPLLDHRPRPRIDGQPPLERACPSRFPLRLL